MTGTDEGGGTAAGGRRARLLRGCLAGAAAFAVATVPWLLHLFDPWEALTWDWRAAVMARPGPATSRVCVVLLDQNSLDWALRENGLTWPWPREVYGAIVDHLTRRGALGVALDVLFTEPSGHGAEDDARFAEALRRSGRTAVVATLGAHGGSAVQLPAGLAQKTFALQPAAGAGAGRIPAFPRAALPVTPVAAAAAALANVHLEPDPDGVYRRVTAAATFDGATFAAAGLASWLAGTPGAAGALERGGIRVGERLIPLDGTGRALLRFRGPAGTHATYSAAAVIQSELREREGQRPVIADPEAFRGKYVFFGFSAAGLNDLHPVPTDRAYPGVEVHATLLDNFLSGDLMRVAPLGVGLGAAAAIALLTGIVLSFVWRPVAVIAPTALLLGVPPAVAFGGYALGSWVPLVYPLAAGGFALVFALIGNYLAEGQQKRFIKSAFRFYLSPEVIEELLANPSMLKLGGERKTISIFFSDLQGFTALSERLAPEELTSVLNDYLTAMTDIITEEGGTVDKYEGDAIIAFWNAPVERPDHPLRAVRTALRCQEKLAELRPGFRARTGRDLFMRIGVNTGPAVVGNLGSRTRFDYSMIGDAVNLAARLEGANKQFGTATMVSESTWALVKDRVRGRELGRIVVVGRSAPVRVYEPRAGAGADAAAPGRERLDASFAAGLAHYYGGRLADAAALFSVTAAEDPAAAAYVRRCEKLLGEQAACDGTWVLDSKG
jgi:adenylate cyclase